MKINWSLLILTLCLGLTTPVLADGTDDLGRLIGQKDESNAAAPAAVNNNEDGIIRLTPDRTHLVRLQEDASSVIVTNPAHASVMLDSPRLLVVMPREPGATSFTVLNTKGDVILEQDVIVSAVQKRYVRVRRMCGNSDPTCTRNAYFYCPDGCYEVMTVPGDEDAGNIPEIAGSMQPQAANPNNNSGAPVMPLQGGNQLPSENPDFPMGADEIDELRSQIEEVNPDPEREDEE